jgi:hypothetical protein
MATDQDSEKGRLSTLYGDMSDGELQEIANEAPRLTDIARQTLAEVIAGRGLDIRLADFIPLDDVELQELVKVGSFRDLPEALLAKGALEAAGLECHLADDNIVRLDWFISSGLGGIKLRVRKQDVNEALAVLGEPIPETFDVEGVGSFEQPRCPRCGSVDIAHQAGLDKRFALPALWALGGIPIPVLRNDWKCQSCGAEWQEIPDEQQTDAPGASS